VTKQRFGGAAPYAEYALAAQENRELWTGFRERARVPEEMVARVEALEGRWHLLVLSEDWCGDAFNTVPVIAALADAASNLELRVLARDRNLDLMDAHLTGGSRSIPVVIVLDDAFRERGWWGPRPRPLQEWFLSEGKLLEPADRYREIRRWYARDRGLTTLEEVVSLLEEAAGKREDAVA